MKLLQINKHKGHKFLNFQGVTYIFFMNMEDFAKLSSPKHEGMLIYFTITLKFKYYIVMMFEGIDPKIASCSSCDVINP